MSTPFVGADFRLETVQAIGLATVRVRFTQDPLVVDPDGANDALNIDNYTIIGPAENFVTGTNAVLEDPQAVDLYLAAPLIVGSWFLQAKTNIVSENSDPLEAPFSLPFSVTFLAQQDTVPKGAVNDAVVNVLRKHFNPGLKGPNWDAVLAGLAAGDKFNWDNATRAFDQMFLPTASGKYLTQRASDQGQRRPPAIAMPEDLFRQLTILSKTSKLTQDAILEVLEVFYGPDAVRASATTTVPGTYRLEDEDDLIVLIDERDQFAITFFREDFSRIGLATPLEVSAVISRQLRSQGSDAYATVQLDADGEETVRIYSGRLGISSSVRVVGGRAQRRLLFPQALYIDPGSGPFATWDLTVSTTTPGYLRFTIDGATAVYDFQKLVEGDQVLVFGQEFAAQNRGSFEIKNVVWEYVGPTLVQYFEVENPAGTAAPNVVQLTFDAIVFHRPYRRTIYDVPRHVIVAQRDQQVDVVIPATTRAVGRQPGTGAYLNLPVAVVPDGVGGASRDKETVTVTSVDPHGLAVGDSVFVEGVFPQLVEASAIPVVAGGAGTTDKSVISVMSDDTGFNRTFHKAVRLPEGEAFIVGGQTQSPGITAVKTPVVFKVTGTSVDGLGRRSATYTWSTLAHVPTIGQQGFGISTSDIRVIVTGGYDGSAGAPTNAWDIFTYAYNPVTDTQISGTMPVARAHHAQATYNGKVLVCGGFTTLGTEIATVYEFNLDTLSWTLKSPMTYARQEHGAVAVGNGVLAIGGRAPSVSANKCISTTEFWNGTTWTQQGSLQFARFGFTTVLLPNDRVLVIGGLGYDPSKGVVAPGVLASCELWDSNTKLWTSIPDMLTPRSYPAATYVPNLNAVVVTGGRGVTSCELLDLNTMTWRKSLASLGQERFHSQAVRVSDDFVLISGGSTLSGPDDNSTALDYIFVPGEETIRTGGMNGIQKVATVPTSSTFTYTTPGYSGPLTSADLDQAIYPFAAQPAPAGLPGPYLFDPKTGIAITSNKAVTNQLLEAGRQYTSLLLSTGGGDTQPALRFPDEDGWLIFNFGRSDQVWPVPYHGRISDIELSLDASFQFPFSVPSGGLVHYVSQRAPFAPGVSVAGFYLTASSAGRIAAEVAMDDTVAAGVVVNTEIVFPGDRGLGAEGFPAVGATKLSDQTKVWGGDNVDAEIEEAKTRNLA